LSQSLLDLHCAQWVAPAQADKPREVAVCCDDFAAVFYGQCGEVGIGHERAVNPSAERSEKIPVPPTGRDQDCPRMLDKALAKR
jgi:hypothetical protein